MFVFHDSVDTYGLHGPICPVSVKLDLSDMSVNTGIYVIWLFYLRNNFFGFKTFKSDMNNPSYKYLKNIFFKIICKKNKGGKK